MIITLYYVEGISRIDTPYFSTLSEQATLSRQEEFFSNHIVQEIETAYYPPHYRNTIRFDSEDLTFNDSVNYLSLEYNGKTYYYFIDDITYISESIIEVDVTMDVIQTYMFDIYISNGIIERKFVNRYYKKSGENFYRINRSHIIRENVSCNEFKITSKTYINTDTSKYVLFVKQSRVDKQTTFGNWAPCEVVSYWNNGSLAPKFPISISVPYDLKFGPGGPYQMYKEDITKFANMVHMTALSSNLAATLDMYVCPFNPFHGITIGTPSAGMVQLSGNVADSAYFNFDDMHGQTVYYFKPSLATGYNMEIRVNNHSLNIYPPSDFNSFVTGNIPQMMYDDNYQRITFGTNACVTQHPLYMVEYAIGFHYTFDPSNGSRIYFANCDDDRYSDTDKYNTMVIDTNILSVDLKNTPWNEYIANNKNRWAQLNMNNITTITKGGLNYAGGMSKVGKIGTDMNATKSYSYGQARNAKGQYTKGMKKLGAIESRSIRDVYGEVPSQGNYASLFGSAVEAGNNIMQQYYLEKNLEAAPASISQLGECLNGFISQEHLIFKQVERVIDFDQCAHYYHRNAFLINEYVDSVDNIFDYVQNRYFFNVLKMSIAEVHLHNVIEDEATCDEIKARLSDGIRLWNVTMPEVDNDSSVIRVVMGNFMWDNVEIDFARTFPYFD